jgi:hypothetical protein
VNDVVGDEFAYSVGMKIGMAVYCEGLPNAANEAAANADHGIDAATVQQIVGSIHECVIFTGQITHVGEYHVEHDMNSFSGCSGAAIIFCWSPTTPSTATSSLSMWAAVLSSERTWG